MEIVANIPFAILNSIGFMAVLFLVYLCLRYFTNFVPATLYSIAVIFQFSGMVQFGFLVFWGSFNLPLTVLWSSRLNSNTLDSYLPFLGLLYLVLLLIFILSALQQFVQLREYKNTADFSITQEWSEWMQLYTKKSNSIQLGWSDKIQSPITFGWLDPIILFPFSIYSQLSVEEVKLILLHEIAHIIRRDYLVNLLIQFSHKILYFNPISYWFVNEIQEQREMACDAWVVRQSVLPIDYSKALFSLAQYSTNHYKPVSLLLSAIGQNKGLISRIRKINQVSNKSIKQFGWELSSAMLMSVFVLFAFLLPKEKNEIKEHATLSPIITKLVIDTKRTQSPNQQNTKHLQAKPFGENNKVAKVLIPKEPNAVEYSSEVELSKNATSYSSLVDKTVAWIQSKENINRFSALDENEAIERYTIAEKLIMRTILNNYQLKRALLQEKLREVENEKEAYDVLTNSKEWQQMLQYEQWTKEFLQKHPSSFVPVDSLREF